MTMSHDALIDQLATGLPPVRRWSMARETALLLAMAGGELALFLGAGVMRPDMGHMIATPYMLWKLGSLALLATVASIMAIRSLSPLGSARRGLTLMSGLAAAVLAIAMLIDPGAVGGLPIEHRLSPLHGMGCAVAIILLSLPMVGAMAWLMRRGAPVDAGRSAMIAGLAAGCWGAFLFSFCCPSDDPLYVALWYMIGCAIVAAMARWLLPRGYRL
jgi:hypothetical protein